MPSKAELRAAARVVALDLWDGSLDTRPATVSAFTHYYGRIPRAMGAHLTAMAERTSADRRRAGTTPNRANYAPIPSTTNDTHRTTDNAQEIR